MTLGAGGDNSKPWFGGDYNPEQWSKDVWREDVLLMQRAGVTVVTLGVFAWSKLEPREGEFDFEWLDEIIGLLHDAGIGIDLATGTASPPPWMISRYPDIRPVTADGVTLAGSSRQTYSPHSANYRRLAARLVEKLAERYGNHPALVAWHVNNEYGCHVSRSYDDEGAASFRNWLADRYVSIGALNEAWGTQFWSQQYSSFNEIEPPRTAPSYINPTHLLDFDRFSSHALLELFRMEAAILRRVSPEVPITTNFMGAFKPLNYWEWAREVDFVSDDSYPDPADPDSPMVAAFTRDLMRSLGEGKPWILMEQATSAVNWRHRNAAKPAGMNRALSVQALARGAAGIMYFQWRQSVRGAEKFHSAMLPHTGPESRIFHEVEALGAELPGLAQSISPPLQTRVALMFDWESWWAIEQPASPTALDYRALVLDWYRALWKLGETVDVVNPSSPLDDYRVVIAPQLFLTSSDIRFRLDKYVSQGGRLIVGFQSGIVEPDLRITPNGYLGSLQTTLGIRIEEFAPLAFPDQFDLHPDGVPTITLDSSLISVGTSRGSYWSEVVTATTARVIVQFEGGDVANCPAITENAYGAGNAWYVATHPDDATLTALLRRVFEHAEIPTSGTELGDGIEFIRSEKEIVLINHARAPRIAVIDGEMYQLQPMQVVNVRQAR